MPAPAPAWCAPYVGIPFVDHGRTDAGTDCWGLVLMVLVNEFGVTAPDYQYIKVDKVADIPSVAKVFYDAVASGDWIIVPEGEEQAGDVVMINEGGVPRHCGIVVAPGQMLHSLESTGSVLDGYRGPRWRASVEGIYRFVGAGLPAP